MKETVSILHIDSRHAVRVSDTEFYVPFNDGYPGESFRDVTNVELHAIRFNGPVNTPYIVIDVNELNNNTFSNVPWANRTFAVIHTVYDTFTNKTVKFDFHDKVKYFNPPLTSLNRLSFRFLDPTTNVPLDFVGYITMIFRITHKKPL